MGLMDKRDRRPGELEPSESERQGEGEMGSPEASPGAGPILAPSEPVGGSAGFAAPAPPPRPPTPPVPKPKPIPVPEPDSHPPPIAAPPPTGDPTIPLPPPPVPPVGPPPPGVPRYVYSEAPAPAAPVVAPPTFFGNNNDVLALVAVILAAMTGAICLSGGTATYCLPLVALILGIVAWINVRKSVNPGRTGTFARISVISMGVVMGLIVLGCIAY